MSTDPVRVSVLVLVNEEEEEVLEVHREAVVQIQKLGVPFEFIYLIGAIPTPVVDGLMSLHEESPDIVRVLRFDGVVGQAGRLAAGFDRARGDVVITLPARFEIDLSAVERLYDAILDGADVVIGARSWKSDSARWQSRIFNRMVSWLTATPFEDVASNMRALRRGVVDEVPLYGEFHRYLPILAHNAGFRIQEIPVTRDSRGTSPFAHSPRMYLWRAMDLLSMFFLSRFIRRPLRLFGTVGSAFGGIGALILLVIGTQRLLGTPLADRPILVLGTLLLGLGVQAFTIGLLGELLLFFHARTVRDYRISQVYEADEPVLPAPEDRP